jgi:hypothetical protein
VIGRPLLAVLAMLAALALAGAPAPVVAHELQPAYLELRATGEAGRYDVLWKQPSVGEDRMRIAPVFPPACRLLAEPRTQRAGTAWVSTARIACEPGLEGATLVIEGLEAYSTDVLLRVEHAGGTVETHVVKPAQPSVTLRRDVAGPAGALAYLKLGVEHILLGVDHLLFVLGLLLIVGDRWSLLKTITAFTIAHSITLAAATLGVVRVPSGPLDVLIALSILFLAPEVVRVWRGQSSLTIRHPWLVAFGFGLLHGFGFASGLAALGLPRSEVPLALLLFNVGVEVGQLAFVAVVMLLLRAFRILGVAWPAAVARLPGYVLGTLGAYWTWQRLAVMLRGWVW